MGLNVLQLSQMRRRLRYHSLDGLIGMAMGAIAMLIIIWFFT